MTNAALPAPSFRAQLVTRRTYNRPLNDEGTVFETWFDTVDRVIGHQRWLWERARGAPLGTLEAEELEELRALMLARKVSMAGRTNWLGGTEIAKRREASMFNPLPRSQTFITIDGVRSFEDFYDGDETTVLTHKGNWRHAKVAYAGVRKMLRLHLRRGRSLTTVKTSADHSWILDDERRLQARELSAGDRLFGAPDLGFYAWDFDAAPADEQLWWCFGFVFGDGALARSTSGYTSRVRLCGGKAAFLPRFTACHFGHSFPPSCDGDPMVYTGAYQKTLPQDTDEPRLIKAFLRGWLDADGHRKNQHGQIRFDGISISDDRAADFFRRQAPVFGLYILQDEHVEASTNYGVRKAHEFSLTTGQGMLWKVENVEDIPDEECWCLTVDDDASFVFPNSVVTSNCSFLQVQTVHDVVDAFWLLLQGCGVGFEPIPGILNGFPKPVQVHVLRSDGHTEKGVEDNQAAIVTDNPFWPGRAFHLQVGDSAEAWAKAVGKILALQEPVDHVVLDFRQIRGAGVRLKGYGWISSGDETISKAFVAICDILNRRADQLLTRIDILDVVNWLGTTLSSRRSAEIALVPWDDPEAEAFAVAKKDYWSTGNPQRAQSNNSIVFWRKPTKAELRGIFSLMLEAGGSEPGFINGVEARRRAPWFRGVNPCAEILLGNRSFCNLCEVDLPKFNGDFDGLCRAVYLVARANYRQTCVNLNDGILQRSWHELNQFLHLTGVSLTGIVRWEYLGKDAVKTLRIQAQDGAHSMADELGLPRSKAVTTVKPSGTISKIMDTTEGAHKPLSRYILNNIRFSKHDPLVEICRAAGYRLFEDPYGGDAVLISVPVAYEDVELDEATLADGRVVHVNNESAVAQLERYRWLMENWVDHNCSVTISYDPSEVKAIVDWLHRHWDSYVGVSFLLRNDPTKRAEDLGYPYLPQQCLTREEYEEYVAQLKPVDIEAASQSSLTDLEIVDDEAECSSGACPIR